MIYLYQHPHWTQFKWNAAALSGLLAQVHRQQGRLIGRLEQFGFSLQNQAVLQTLTQDVLTSSEIEGIVLDKAQVRSSIAQRLGIDIGAVTPSDRHVDGIVEMMLDATRQYQQPLTAQRLFGWHAAMFPGGWSGLHKIRVGCWRDDHKGPMQVVSGPLGREVVHYEAPPAAVLDQEIQAFLSWFNTATGIDPVIKAGLAHLWFVTLHPFDDGNGRIARAITDMALAQAEQSAQRFYSMSAQIRLERSDYYNTLELTQKGDPDVTPWLVWFLGCLDRAINGAQVTLSEVLYKADFWSRLSKEPLNERQHKILNRLLDGFDGKLTTSKWAKLGNCSQDTAYRDILNLTERGILVKNPQGGRSTSYQLAHYPEDLPH